MSDRSYRCQSCNVAWPLIDEATSCPQCGGKTWRSLAQPAHTPDDVRALLAKDAVLTASPAHANRVERYRDMGFSEVDAEVMACCKDGKGFYLYHHDIRRQLDAGLTHALAVQIYA